MISVYNINEDTNDMQEVLKMESAKLMTDGQVTIPVQIMKKLNLKEGDKIMFIENDSTVQIIKEDFMKPISKVEPP